MAEINDLLSNISNIKTDIKSAIENKGQNVTNLASYPNAILNIASGGSSGIKIFDSIANMQNSSNSSTGDLAIVYSSTIDSITENTQFQEGTFPETVILSTAVSDYIGLQFKAVDESIMFDCGGEIGPDYMQMSCYMDDGSGDWKEYRIEYTSSDGLTYTRTRFQKNQEDISGNVMDFGTVIMFGSRWGEPTWDDRIGDFIKAGTTSFEGMYKYNGINYNWANTGLTALSEDVYKGKFYGNNIITNGTGNTVTNLNIDQLKNRINLYNNLSYLTTKNNENLQALFESKDTLLQVPNINMINSDNTYRMFTYCYNLVSVSNFDLSNIKNTSYMFSMCSNLTTIPNFDLANVIDMSYMFSGCFNLTTIPNFNTLNVTNMRTAFERCYNITTIPNFNTSNVNCFNYIFDNCLNLLNIPNFDLSNATDIGFMFHFCKNITTIPNFNTQKVKSMYATFAGCENITTIPNFNTSNVTTMGSMFSGCYNLTSVPNFNTSNVTSIESMFRQCYNLTIIPNINTSNVTSMYYTFYRCKNLTTIPNFDTSNVNIMGGMFQDCYNLISIPNINTSNVDRMESMFNCCYNLVDVPLLSMNKVNRCVSMFNNCNNLSDASYANICNSLPNAAQLTNLYLANTGLNINRFTSAQNIILQNKGYLEFQQNYYTIIYS